MKETQASIGRWANETFPGSIAFSPRKAIRALEEMVELCFAAGATSYEVREAVSNSLYKVGNRPDPGKVPEEAADVLINLYAVAYDRHFDIHSEVDRKMEINRGREWAARGDGTGYHIKKGESVV